jgi:hypothetical protein
MRSGWRSEIARHLSSGWCPCAVIGPGAGGPRRERWTLRFDRRPQVAQRARASFARLRCGCVSRAWMHLDGIDARLLPPGGFVATRCTRRWWMRQSGTAYSSLALRPSARFWRKRRWCGSQGLPGGRPSGLRRISGPVRRYRGRRAGAGAACRRSGAAAAARRRRECAISRPLYGRGRQGGFR